MLGWSLDHSYEPTSMHEEKPRPSEEIVSVLLTASCCLLFFFPVVCVDSVWIAMSDGGPYVTYCFVYPIESRSHYFSGRGFKVSWFLGLKVSEFQSFKASKFQSFKVSMIPHYQKQFHVFW